MVRDYLFHGVMNWRRNPILLITFSLMFSVLAGRSWASPGPPPTPPPPLAISGAILYCSNPIASALAGATLNLTGSLALSTTSDAAGNYRFTNLTFGANYTVTPTKSAVTPGSMGINTIDVIAEQRHFLQIALLTGCRLAAGDVNGDATINTVDVIAIQRFFLSFAMGIANTGKYSFNPPNRSYSPLPGDQTGQNYDALVFGDVASPFVVPTGIPTPSPTPTPPGMLLIPAGSFVMGDTLDGMTNAVPVSTAVSAFYIDGDKVTLSQWQSVYSWATSNGYTFTRAGSGKAANHPVQTVQWFDAVKWCNARSEKEGKTPVYYTDDAQVTVYRSGQVDITNAQVKWNANGYRLPTEAEWERAARGGVSGQRFPWGNTISESLANYYGNTDISYDQGPNGFNEAFVPGGFPYTNPGGAFAPNAYGLYDMAGNTFDWCWDWYGTPYAGGTDPHGPITGFARIGRGGSWQYEADIARCAFRFSFDPAISINDFGFRVVISAHVTE
jgi:formylglycine-generating enzyme